MALSKSNCRSARLRVRRVAFAIYLCPVVIERDARAASRPAGRGGVPPSGAVRAPGLRLDATDGFGSL